jgi:hypothetical protein
MPRAALNLRIQESTSSTDPVRAPQVSQLRAPRRTWLDSSQFSWSGRPPDQGGCGRRPRDRDHDHNREPSAADADECCWDLMWWAYQATSLLAKPSVSRAAGSSPKWSVRSHHRYSLIWAAFPPTVSLVSRARDHAVVLVWRVVGRRIVDPNRIPPVEQVPQLGLQVDRIHTVERAIA